MVAIKSDIVEFNENINNIKEVSKLIYETIEPAISRVKEISETIEPVVVHMSETIQNINLQLEPIRTHINEFIEVYSKSIQPFIESISNIKESFDYIYLSIEQIMDKYNFKEIIVKDEDINNGTELLNYINENIDINLDDSYIENNIQEDIICSFENIILRTQDISSGKFNLKTIFESIKKEIINYTLDNTLIKNVILPLLLVIIPIIINNLMNCKPSNEKYTINNSQYIEYKIENNENNISNKKVNIFKVNDIKSDCKYIVDKNKIDLLEIVKSQQEWSYIKFKIDDLEFEGWIISDELK